MAAHFSMSFWWNVDFKGKFLRVDNTLGADITLKVITTLCTFSKMDKIYIR